MRSRRARLLRSEVMGATIYGEAGGASYEDKLGVGWTMRNRFEAGRGLTYEQIAETWFAPQYKLRIPNLIELKAWNQSFGAGAEVLNASPHQNPIPGVTHFFDPSITAPSWGNSSQVPHGSITDRVPFTSTEGSRGSLSHPILACTMLVHLGDLASACDRVGCPAGLGSTCCRGNLRCPCEGAAVPNSSPSGPGQRRI